MATWSVEVERLVICKQCGTVKVEADSEEEALEAAEAMPDTDVDWCNLEYEFVEVEGSDNEAYSAEMDEDDEEENDNG